MISLVRVSPQGRQTQASKSVQTPVSQMLTHRFEDQHSSLAREGLPRRVLPAQDSGRQPRPELHEEGQGNGQADSKWVRWVSHWENGASSPYPGRLSKRLNKPGRSWDGSVEVSVVPTGPTAFLLLTHRRASGMSEGLLELKEQSPPTTTLPGQS